MSGLRPLAGQRHGGGQEAGSVGAGADKGVESGFGGAEVWDELRRWMGGGVEVGMDQAGEGDSTLLVFGDGGPVCNRGACCGIASGCR